MANSKCPVCKAGKATFAAHSGGADRTLVECINCGKFEISNTAFATLSYKKKDTRLSFSIKSRFDRGEDVYLITTNREAILDGISFPVKIKDIAELILLHVFKNEENTHGQISIAMENSVRFGIENNSKMRLVIDYIESKNWFEVTKFSGGGAHLSLTGDGVAYADDIMNPNYKSKQVFVAMSFEPDLDHVFTDAIQVAANQCKLNALRSKDFSFNDEIIKNIQSQIDNSRFAVADFTDNKSGVYFEAGYATGKNIPVIYCCNEDHKKNIHFDINHFNFIFWNDPESLKNNLVKRIKNTGLMD